jgi:2-alkenal reductase
VNPVVVARAGLSGVVVDTVRRGSPAAEAGMQALDRRTGDLGDVIVAVNGVKVETLSTFIRELDRVGIGNVAEITLSNDGKERTVRTKVIDVR